MNYEIDNGILYTVTHVKCPDCSERGRIYKLDHTGSMREQICNRCSGASMIQNDIYLLEPVEGIFNIASKIPHDYDA